MLLLNYFDATIKQVKRYKGRVVLDSSKQDGPPRKLLDIGKLEGLDGEPAICLVKGLSETYDWYCELRHIYKELWRFIDKEPLQT